MRGCPSGGLVLQLHQVISFDHIHLFLGF